MANGTARPLIDFLLFIGLIALFIYAYKGTYRYMSLHNESLIHQLDRNFTDQLYTAQRQVRVTSSLLDQMGKLAAHQKNLDKIITTLADIEDKYVKNSPGLLFLGPLATTSIVLKEQELENKLLASLNQLSMILQPLVPNSKPHQDATSIEAALQVNQDYIGYLLKLTSVVP